MGYTPENNPYIPGDPYSYDLKWMVSEIKRALEMYDSLNQSFDDLYDYVHDYLDNLDFPAAVSDKIDQMAEDGTLADIIRPFLKYEYNVNDYEGNTLNERWDNMRADFISWRNKTVLIPYPQTDDPACIQVGSDIKWKISAPLVFDDSCNCMDISIMGELYAVAPLDQVLLFDDASKPENINFGSGVIIRGNRFDGNTIANAIEIRSGARINFFGQTIINDCVNGVLIGGDDQSAPASASFDKIHVGFFDSHAVYVYGNTYVASISANTINSACAQNAGLDTIVLQNHISNSMLGFCNYDTDVPKDGYVTNDANSVIKLVSGTEELRDVNIRAIYATTALYGFYCDATAGQVVADVVIGYIGTAGATNTAAYVRRCRKCVIMDVKHDSKIDMASCYSSFVFRGETNAGDTYDRFAGIASTINIDTDTAFVTVPSIANKNLGAFTIVKNASGKHVYLNDGDENILCDGLMYVPSIASLPAAAWNLRGKMYRINNDAGTDQIAICIRYNANYAWYDLIAGAVI